MSYLRDTVNSRLVISVHKISSSQLNPSEAAAVDVGVRLHERGDRADSEVVEDLVGVFGFLIRIDK